MDSLNEFIDKLLKQNLKQIGEFILKDLKIDTIEKIIQGHEQGLGAEEILKQMKNFIAKK